MPKPLLEVEDPKSQTQDDQQNTQNAQKVSQESPLASQMPDWDLVPPHTLLVRRRTVKP